MQAATIAYIALLLLMLGMIGGGIFYWWLFGPKPRGKVFKLYRTYYNELPKCDRPEGCELGSATHVANAEECLTKCEQTSECAAVEYTTKDLGKTALNCRTMRFNIYPPYGMQMWTDGNTYMKAAIVKQSQERETERRKEERRLEKEKRDKEREDKEKEKDKKSIDTDVFMQKWF